MNATVSAENAMPYEVALFLKDFYADDLFQNENLGSLELVPVQKKDAQNNALYIIQAGVYDTDKQKDAVVVLKDDFSIKVPSFLTMPALVKRDDVEVIPAIIKNNAAEENGTFKIDTTHFRPEKIDVSILQTDPFYGQTYSQKYNPLKGGVSIYNNKIGNFGTLGSVIKLNNSTDRYILSNWHVLVGSVGVLGDIIVQPGPKDGGRLPQHDIGKLVWCRLDQHMDAAIAKLNNKRTHSFGTMCTANIQGITAAFKGQDVEKCGRTTKNLVGKVLRTNFDVRVRQREYPGNKKLLFKNQIKTTKVSEDGDSGSILLDRNSKEAVGLIFAGDNRNFSIANHLHFNKPLLKPTMSEYNEGYDSLAIEFS